MRSEVQDRIHSRMLVIFDSALPCVSPAGLTDKVKQLNHLTKLSHKSDSGAPLNSNTHSLPLIKLGCEAYWGICIRDSSRWPALLQCIHHRTGPGQVFWHRPDTTGCTGYREHNILLIQFQLSVTPDLLWCVSVDHLLTIALFTFLGRL